MLVALRLDTAEHPLIKINYAMRPANPVSYTSSCNHHIRAFSHLPGCSACCDFLLRALASSTHRIEHQPSPQLPRSIRCTASGRRRLPPNNNSLRLQPQTRRRPAHERASADGRRATALDWRSATAPTCRAHSAAGVSRQMEGQHRPQAPTAAHRAGGARSGSIHGVRSGQPRMRPVLCRRRSCYFDHLFILLF